MAHKAPDAVAFSTSTTGTADWAVGSAAAGGRTPATAGVANGDTFVYRAESSDRTQWELGIGTYSTTGPTLARTRVLASSAGGTTKTTFTAGPTVYSTVSAAMIPLASPDASTALSAPQAAGLQAIGLGKGQATGDRSLALGDVIAPNGQEEALGFGTRSVWSRIVAEMTTSNATPTDFTHAVNGSSSATFTSKAGSFALPVYVNAIILAQQSTATAKAWRLEGFARDNGSALTIIGSVTKTVIQGDAGASAWDVAATVTASAWKFTVTGAAATTIRWSLFLEQMQGNGA